MEIHYPLILDGSTGTQLQKRGFEGGMSSESWSMLHPEVVKAFQKEYIEAGSQVLYSPTFGANRVKMEENRVYNQVFEYNKTPGVDLQGGRRKERVCRGRHLSDRQVHSPTG